MIITRKSIFTGKERERDLDITQEQWDQWNGTNPPLIQFCFPQLSKSDREFILTGSTDDEWDEFMGDPDEITDGGC